MRCGTTVRLADIGWRNLRNRGAARSDRGRTISASNATIRFGTLQSFKGLEADAVVLCEAERARSPEQLYVAASRAKHVLYYIEEAHA